MSTWGCDKWEEDAAAGASSWEHIDLANYTLIRDPNSILVSVGPQDGDGYHLITLDFSSVAVNVDAPTTEMCILDYGQHDDADFGEAFIRQMKFRTRKSGSLGNVWLAAVICESTFAEGIQFDHYEVNATKEHVDVRGFDVNYATGGAGQTGETFLASIVQHSENGGRLTATETQILETDETQNVTNPAISTEIETFIGAAHLGLALGGKGGSIPGTVTLEARLSIKKLTW